MTVDAAARYKALTDLDSTLLVEAAAGTGKTALIAGRVVMLLAKGVEPFRIAAITFTELAASELAFRVRQYVADLLRGEVPAALALAFPSGISDDARQNLAFGASRLDELTAATIHSFCQRVILSHVVEANIDPGAIIIDADQADSAFQAVVNQWLKGRLGEGAEPSDPIVVLSRTDPRGVVDTLRLLARFRRDYRRADTLPADLSGRPDVCLVDAIQSLGRWLGAQVPEPSSLKIFELLEQLQSFYSESFQDVLDFERLWHLGRPPFIEILMRKGSRELVRPGPRCRSAWIRADKANGAQLFEEFTDHFDRVDEAYRALLGKVSTAVVAAMADHLKEILDEYAAFKRRAAVLDFDDLIEKALDLVEHSEAARVSLGHHYGHILVDEFQDTDQSQCRILFGIAANEAGEWQSVQLRPGALFLVGDPKQAIYGFRGASVETYLQAREAINRQTGAEVVNLSGNFRSRAPILEHVNRCFEKPLSGYLQPGYVPLSPTLPPAEHGLPCVAKLEIKLEPGAYAPQVRRAEAAAVADLCHRLLASFEYRDESGKLSRLRPGGIALLAPQFSSLEIYEEVFEGAGLPFVSQAGKNLFRRQETQDVLALIRALADPRDTAAFGAFLRGPLVGLSDQALLDITARLGVDSAGQYERFTILTDPAKVEHSLAKSVLVALQDLRKLARVTTPALVVGQALDRLTVLPLLKLRGGPRWVQMAANLEVILDRARNFDVGGFKALAQDLQENWADRVPTKEGRVDAAEAISVVTMHSAKGLEWPVVIPINTVSQFAPRRQHVYRPSDNTLHWLLGDVASPELKDALEKDAQATLRERERLMYVACTRARELLVIPDLQRNQGGTWTSIVDLSLADVPVIRLRPAKWSAPPSVDHPNGQTQAVFAAEAQLVSKACTPLKWQRPTDHDADRSIVLEIASPDGEITETSTLGAGRLRGLILHKLIEEVLNAETLDTATALDARSNELIDQLRGQGGDEPTPDPKELSATVLMTLGLPEIALLRKSLIPEVPVYATFPSADGAPMALAGRIDALAIRPGEPPLPIDWKSDVDPSKRDIELHARQLGDYLRALRAPRGALVYMTTGLVHWVTAKATAEAEATA